MSAPRPGKAQAASAADQAGLPARVAALEALRRIEEEGAWVGRLNPDARGTLDPRQRRQATEYLAGVTRHRRWLDFLIGSFYHDKVERLDLEVRQALRIGLYDLLVASTPPHAAVSQAVELVRAAGRPQAAGLVNALLRRALRQKGDMPEPATGKPAADLAIRHSHPTWLVERWLSRFGPEETQALLRWNNRRPSHSLRLNPLKADLPMLAAELDRMGVEWSPGRYLSDSLRVRRLQAVLAAELLARGWCVVQDEAAALVVKLLDPQAGERILDACAAPGGKALYAAALMQNRGTLVAVDRNGRRLAQLEEAADRLGVTIAEAKAGDIVALIEAGAEGARPLGPAFDRVLIDAPCTGTGVLAKRADLRWQRRPADLTQLCQLQDRILDAAASQLRPGGLLVYATCSLEPEENLERVMAFLSRSPDFCLESAEGLLSSELLSAEGCYAALPHRHDMDGAFAARLRRSE